MSLKKLKKSLKLVTNKYSRAKCKYIKYYENLPIDEKAILFESQNATKADGNILYMMKYITSNEQYKDFKFYISSWGRYVNQITQILEREGIENVKVVIYSSDEYVRLLASAKYILIDSNLPGYYYKKDGQKLLDTWHGTPLKALGKSIRNAVNYGAVIKDFCNSDILLYPNEYTKDIMIRDFMLENIASGSYVLGGYPRNEAFFNETDRTLLREEYGLEGKRVYAYMPTWRGTSTNVGGSKDDAFLMYYLYEIDKRMTDDEIMYINLHPMAEHSKNGINVEPLKHIKKFPKEYETYRFLNICDVLLTDYSSVFFDFSITHKKVVLFPYDREEYYDSRGAYMSLDELPFPKVYNVDDLMAELRSERNYDDKEFINEFAPYENPNASQKLCDLFILGKDTGLEPHKIPHNGKENVLIFGGALKNNGITTSLRNLLNTIDLDKRNYYFTFSYKAVKNNVEQLFLMNPEAKFFPFVDHVFNLTIFDHIVHNLFKNGILKTKLYLKLQKKRLEQNFERAFGRVKFDHVIQFSGYGNESILQFSVPDCNTGIYVHNDMVNEINMRGNQRKDVLKYAYNTYDHILTVTDDLIEPTAQIAGSKKNFSTVRNTIDYQSIIEKSKLEIEFDVNTQCSVEKEYFDEVISSDIPKFINVGRYSVEKGHERLVDAFAKFISEGNDAYLIIMGGNSLDDGYNKLIEKVYNMGLSEKVILLLSLSNPYPIIKACDYFILSSFYEGFGLVLAEADILGLPIVSTDIVGPRLFMQEQGGTLVENSDNGVYQGLKMLYNNEIKHLNVDFESYNQKCVDEFEQIFK